MAYETRDASQDSKELLLPQNDARDHDMFNEYNRPRPMRWIYISITFLLISTNLFTYGLTWLLTRTHDSSSTCLKGIGQDVIKPLQPPQTVTFESTIRNTSVYRSGASEEVDEAWKALGVEFKYSVLSPEDAIRASISPDHVSLPENSFRTEAGVNVTEGGYVANVEVMHQLHCLNFLRKSLWFNVDYYKELGRAPFSDPDDVLIMHVGHCLDMLREKLMCDADTGFVPYYWLKSKGRTTPDFRRPHVCGDFEGVREWARVGQRWLQDGVEMSGPAEGAFRVEDFP